MFRSLSIKISKVLLLLLIFISIGIFGYMFFEGYSFVDALYMTVITLSTVGSEVVKPLSSNGKIFTVFLILSGVGVLAYAASIFAEELISGKFMQRYKKRNVENKIKKLEGHVIICGFGRNGRQAARKLNTYNKPFVVIERSLREMSEHKGLEKVIFIEGDGTQDDVLEKAQIESASALIAALPSDADNLFIVLSAKQLNPKIKIISRASDRPSIKKLKIAGADNVIMPDKIGGEHMASLIVTPDLVEFIDKLSVDSSVGINMIEVAVDDFDSEYVGKTIKDLNMRHLTGCTIIGLKNENGEYQINPEYETVLSSGDYFIILGKPEQIDKLYPQYGIKG